jgi:hypothetical protein
VNRWARKILCALSLLVFVASVALWVRSYSVEESIAHRCDQVSAAGQDIVTRTERWTFECSRGAIGVAYFRGRFSGFLHGSDPWTYYASDSFHDLIQQSWPRDSFNVRFGKFQLRSTRNLDGDDWSSERSLVLPLWLLLPAAIPPIFWWKRWRGPRGRGFPVALASATEH